LQGFEFLNPCNSRYIIVLYFHYTDLKLEKAETILLKRMELSKYVKIHKKMGRSGTEAKSILGIF